MNNKTILESISDGVFTVDEEWKITYLNRAAEEMIQVSRDEAIGRYCCEVFRSSLCEEACALKRTIDQGKPIIDLACTIINNNGKRIPVSISTAVLKDEDGNIVGGAETFRILKDLEVLKEEMVLAGHIGELSSHSSSMKLIFAQLPDIAESDSTVLISGETGSGKELLAQTIHNESLRKHKPFVAINCGAFPDTLLESELFGYKRGAFTGAVKDKPGRFAQAEGGTLFLDEIGEISPAMQVRLLRVLQERVYEPLGSLKSEKSNVRIICATNKNLSELITKGEFREDLFYRINVVNMSLPPLRERMEDLHFLVDVFIRRCGTGNNRNVYGISNRAMGVLAAHDWPGNIRELFNIIEYAEIFCKEGIIDVEHLPKDFTNKIAPHLLAHPEANKMADKVRGSEELAIINALNTTNGNRRKAAELLGIHYSTFYRKLKKLELDVKLPDGRHTK